MNRIVVMGSSGRLGRMLRASWGLKPNLAFVPIYQYRRPALSNWDLFWSSNVDPADFARSLRNLCPISSHVTSAVAAMIILAGVTPTSGGRLDENTAITRACLLAAQAAGIKRVLIASSSAVYGIDHTGPITEQTLPAPSTEYGRQKFAMEQLCQQPAWRHLEISILRIGNVAGADALMLNHYLNPNAPLPLDVFPNGKSLQRSYVGPMTLAAIFETLLSTQYVLPPVINIAAPLPVYMDDLALAAGVTWRPRWASSTIVQDITLDTSLLQMLHRFGLYDSSPMAMVQQLKKIGL